MPLLLEELIQFMRIVPINFLSLKNSYLNEDICVFRNTEK